MSDEQELFVLLYTQLKRRAQGQLRRVPQEQTLRPTELVHEAYARLMRRGCRAWQSRSQFFAVAVRAMRDILVEAIRRKCTSKGGGDLVRVTLTNVAEPLSFVDEDLTALANALDRLEREYPDLAHIVLLRFLAGFTMKEIARMDGVSTRTIERRWRFARAWLQEALRAQ